MPSPRSCAEPRLRCRPTSQRALGARETRDYARFLNIAQGSVAEVEYLLILSRDLGYIPPTAFDRLVAEVDEIARMLHGLRAKVEAGT